MAVTQVNLSDQMAVFVQKTNIISGDLGDVNALTTATDSNAVAAINELETNHNSLSLTVSTIQTNLNNLDSDVGDRASLVTNDRSDLVTAINEVKADANGIATGLNVYVRKDQNNVINGGTIRFNDNDALSFGDDSDLVIVHSGGTNSITGNIDLTGNLDITGRITTDAITENVSGNVGINTSTPASLLEIKASALNRANGIALRGSGANDILYMYPSADNVATIEHLIDGSTSTGSTIVINPQGGNVGIGTSNPVSKFNVDTGNIVLSRTTDGDGNELGEFMFWNRTNAGSGTGTTFVNDVASIQGKMVGTGNNSGGSLHFYTKPDAGDKNERMRIVGGGNIFIGQTSTDNPGQGNSVYGLSLTQSGRVFASANSTYSLGLNRSDTGELTNFSRAGSFKGSINVSTSGTTYNTTSDERLKENIETLENGTELLKAMRAVTYNWKADGNSDTGFIAQEMNEVMPQAVSEGDDGMLSMDYGRITPIIVAALQDALKRIDELEAKQCNCGGCS